MPVTTAGLDAAALRETFDATEPFTVGLEEEVLLVDPRSGHPSPTADAVVAAAADPRITTELPACQVELVTRPHRAVSGAMAELADARRALARTCRATGRGVPIAAAVHPLVADHRPSRSPRSAALADEYRLIARRQLVGALQVHVALGCATRALAVYNALRGLLPELAALAAAAPFHDGRDTELASVRPLVAGQLPRQGVPPVLPSWEAYAEDLRWGAASGTVRDPGRWWWELRPHVQHGTLEVRVPDVQPTLAAGAAIVSVVHATVRHLAARHDRGEPLGAPPGWRIAENRWAALRDGVHGHLADLETGERIPTRRRLLALLDDLEPHAVGGLDAARALAHRNAADDLRAVGLRRAVPWMAEVFEG